MKKQCKKSPNGNHQMRYPRYEESIDKERLNYPPYCEHCNMTEEELGEKNKGNPKIKNRKQ